MKHRRWALVVTALALVLAFVGAVPAMAQQAQQAILRAVHAVPNGPAVDVYVDNNLVFSNVQYKEVTDYASLSAGSHQVRIVRAGSGAQGQALIQSSVNLNADSYNTVVAIGEPNNPRPLALVNDSTLPTLTQSKVRVVHASPNAPAVDVAVTGGQVLFSNVAFGQPTAYKVVPAQTYNLEIRQAGTNSVVLPVPNVKVDGATVYTIYAVGLANGQPPLDTVVAVDAPPPQAFQAVKTPGTPQATASPSPATPTTAASPTVGTPTGTISPLATPSPVFSVTPSAVGSPAAATQSPAATASPMATQSPAAATPSATSTP